MKKLFSIVIALMVWGAIQAQDGRFWAPVNEASLGKNVFANRYKPQAYRLFSLNEMAIQSNLTLAPSERNVAIKNSAYILNVPDENGNMQAFKVVEAMVMDPALAAKYPSIKSYAGVGITDPTATIRLDFSPRGFHAMILSAKHTTIYIDPVDADSHSYVVFARKDVVNYQKTFQCLTAESAQNQVINAAPPIGFRGADDGRLRTYRLALACTGEYANYFLNGTETSDAQRKAKVLAAMNTLMTRTNAIYERDFGVRMNLIANNDAIIYLNASTDPWSTEWNTKTQQTIDAVIGNANYDIGHLVHKESTAANNNGNAGCIGCVCKTGSKGSAFTSHVIPEGDPFVVDYTTHEMGHQFGANHTFTFSNETGTGAQMEPGSGSTIMGYAGITGATNDVQPHSDDYFHARSIEQVTDYIKLTTGGGACAVVTVTGNATPTVNAGLDYTIPKSTPFTLTGTAADADAADVLTYVWEQFNTGTSTTTIPSATATSGPVFRSRNYTVDNSRTFPILASVLDGTNGNKWERLPSVARTLAFRFTARDNHAGGGNNNSDNMNVTISSATGPFAVTAPNTAVTWAGGSAQTITWSVAGSNGAPVNCANVKISLSTDGGLTFPTVLAASTPNDGTEVLTIPTTPSTTARVKIEAVGNIFFDISNTNFTIGGAVVCGNPGGLTASAIGNNTATLSWTAVSGALSYDVDYKATASATWINAATATTATTVNVAGLTQGTLHDYRVRATCTAGTGAYTSAQFTTTAPFVCAAPTGLAASAITATTATIGWSAVSGAVSYLVEYKASASATWIVAAAASTATSVNLTGLSATTIYDWRVTTNCSTGTSSASAAQFTTIAVSTCTDIYEPNNTSATAKPITLGVNNTGLIGVSGDNDYYTFSNTSTQRRVRVSLTNLAADYDMKLYRPSGTLQATAQNSGTANELIIYNNSTTSNVGTYRLWVYGYSGAFNATQCYTLNVQISATNFTARGDVADAVDVLRNGGIKAYPNPASSAFTISFDAYEKGNAVITLSNQVGQEVLRKNVGVNNGINVNTVDVSKLKAGVYIIKVYNGKDVQTQKLVISR